MAFLFRTGQVKEWGILGGTLLVDWLHVRMVARQLGLFFDSFHFRLNKYLDLDLIQFCKRKKASWATSCPHCCVLFPKRDPVNMGTGALNEKKCIKIIKNRTAQVEQSQKSYSEGKRQGNVSIWKWGLGVLQSSKLKGWNHENPVMKRRFKLGRDFEGYWGVCVCVFLFREISIGCNEMLNFDLEKTGLILKLSLCSRRQVEGS